MRNEDSYSHKNGRALTPWAEVSYNKNCMHRMPRGNRIRGNAQTAVVKHNHWVDPLVF